MLVRLSSLFVCMRSFYANYDEKHRCVFVVSVKSGDFVCCWGNLISFLDKLKQKVNGKYFNEYYRKLFCKEFVLSIAV